MGSRANLHDRVVVGQQRGAARGGGRSAEEGVEGGGRKGIVLCAVEREQVNQRLELAEVRFGRHQGVEVGGRGLRHGRGCGVQHNEHGPWTQDCMDHMWAGMHARPCAPRAAHAPQHPA